jgi:mycofactocin system transcriptional regulator
MASSARKKEAAGTMIVARPEPGPRVGRRRSTTPHQITDVALGLFAERGFDAVSVDDVARAAGISRRTLFRYYASKNAIPWGDFDAHLQHLRQLLGRVAPDVPLGAALRAALLAFNTFDESETIRHRQRMRVILQTAELQAYSMTMYAGCDRGVRCPPIRRGNHRPAASDRCLADAWSRVERLRALAGRRIGVVAAIARRRVRRGGRRT